MSATTAQAATQPMHEVWYTLPQWTTMLCWTTALDPASAEAAVRAAGGAVVRIGSRDLC